MNYWVLSGPVPGVSHGNTSVNFVSTHVLKVECSDCDLDTTLKAFWDLDTLGIKDNESSVYEDFIQTIDFKNAYALFDSELHDNNPALRCEDFSTLRRLLRVTGCVQKFIERVKAKLKDRTVDPELSASDITAAELYGIKVVQKSLMKNVKFSIWKWQFGITWINPE
ncbi:hypothetical protein EMCRGX_G018824 [Ephydatia muelleri]